MSQTRDSAVISGWRDAVPDPIDIREYFEERAGVLEFDHNLSRAEAEHEARRRTLARYGEQAASILGEPDHA